jgi:4-hydroxy-tetrahydrodipicolinate reductase
VAWRVVHWGTGSTGTHGLRAILRHPELELVGLHVHSANKVGLDAGELCGLGPTGVIATDDLDATLALDADCLSYMADGVNREPDVCADVIPFLERGTNVVTCSLIPFTFPPGAPIDQRERLAAACRAGSTSLFNSGIDPGYATGHLAASLLALASEIECVRVQELGNFSRYGAATIMREIFGFGQPPDYVPPLFTSGMLLHYWRGTVLEIADVLGIELDDIRLMHETAAVDHDVDTAFGRVDAGTIGVIRFEILGLQGGTPRVVVEHVDRVDADIAPQWDRAAGTAGTAYRIVVTGRPSFSCELDFTQTGGASGAVVATATFLVNAIPAVCTARPGLLGLVDVPAFVGRPARRTEEPSG